MKKIITLIILVAVISFAANAQTNVSGGIYNNTTWTLANSPYIVTDTVVVFPGVTLTIEPGVTVKFEDGKYIQIRQGTLIATGTATDSITITSNSVSPTKGIYRGFQFTNPGAIAIDYCIFKYADNPLDYCCLTIDTLFIKHSYFYMNNKCLSGNYSKTAISESSFYNNTYCIDYSPHLISVRKSLFQNNINCFGDNNNEEVENLVLDSCSFISNTIAAHIGRTCLVTNCVLVDNTVAFNIEGDLSFANHTIKNSTFCRNGSGIWSIYSSVTNSDTLINCNFSNNGSAYVSMVAYMTGNIFTDNNTAVDFRIRPTDSIFNNYIFHNRIGIVYRGGATSTFFNNYICNNSDYNINYLTSLNGSIPPVCFCDTDSLIIRSKIYDGYVDITRGLLSFIPVIQCDSSVITSLLPISCPAAIVTGIDKNSASETMMDIYPNPATHAFTIRNILSNKSSLLQIINLIGEIVYTENISGRNEVVVDAKLSPGIYIVHVGNKEKNIVAKLVVE